MGPCIGAGQILMILTPILPTLISGQMTTLAWPATAELTMHLLGRDLGLIAESNWNSPSMARSGRRSLAISRARRTLSTSSLSIEPSVECESSAQRISHPVSERTVSLGEIAIEASSLALMGQRKRQNRQKPKGHPSPPFQLGMSAIPHELTVSTPSAKTDDGLTRQDDIARSVIDTGEHNVDIAEHLQNQGALKRTRHAARSAPLGLNLQSGCER